MNKRQVDDMKSMKGYCNSVGDCGLCIMKKRRASYEACELRYAWEK